MRLEDDHGDAAPRRLVSDLQALHQPSAGVPAEVDEAILTRARRHLSARRRRRRLLVCAVPVAAAAGLVLWLAVERRARDGGAGEAIAAEDVDGNGRVDIIDAYVLALRIEQGLPSGGGRWDLNGDGALDRRDVDLVASRAVRIGS